jgi:hypothetical protein
LIGARRLAPLALLTACALLVSSPSTSLGSTGAVGATGGPGTAGRVAALPTLALDPLAEAALLTEGSEGLFGFSVAMSADGRTALIGAPRDGASLGTAYVFTRTTSGWNEQAQLTGSEESRVEPEEPCVEEPGEGEACRFGTSVGLSADGNTAIVGAPRENGPAGAIWVFSRSGSTWSQQGPKISGAAESHNGHFGRSVALSGDGDIGLVGAPSASAAWILTRSGSTWTLGQELTGVGDTGGHFGHSVALSEDGSTALVGDPSDGGSAGAAWAFGQTGSVWAAQGGKLTGSEESGEGRLGYSVALSGDGATALVGGRADGHGVGAAWAFARTGSTWAPDGPKLTGGGETGAGRFGQSVALSQAGTSALIGGLADNLDAGAAWRFERGEEDWTQTGPKLEAPTEEGRGRFGASVALSADGASGIVGAPHDGAATGSAWVFPGAPLPPPPTVAKVTPAKGSTDGGTQVTITGTGFLAGATVQIGSPAKVLEVVSATEIRAQTAPAAAGADEVVVADADGTSTGGPSFTYVTPPAGGGGGGVGTTTEPTNTPASNPTAGVLGTTTATTPTPTLATTGVLNPITGQVFVKLPGTNNFVPLTSLRAVPFGVLIDATHGKLAVITTNSQGASQTMDFYQGEFVLTQGSNGLAVATLAGGNFSSCHIHRAHGGRTAARSARRRPSRKLWASGHGTYSTRGNYATGAVLGTRWLTEDLCTGTLIRVITDRVAVTNLVTHRHITVKAGHSYFAKAP